jgi:hypothetical protein
MDGKKKVVKKHAQETHALKELLSRYVKPRYDIDVSPGKEAFASATRSDFLSWIDRVYQPKTKATSDKATSTTKSIELFEHQKFIKDYLQYQSPYRGLLLYHGIGVGKSCSSIAAAEILSNHMQVVVMLPASLRDNYIGEIKKCGTLFYGVHEHHWVFFPETSVDAEAIRLARIDAALVKHNKGIWVPSPDKNPNWNELEETHKEAILSQIDLMIRKNVQFINYNGLNRKAIEKLVEGGKNPFDDKCVVIDEIHNLVSVICNGGIIGSAIYKLLMQAKRMKIILLSGTPLINYPHEIAYLINLVTGPRNFYDIKIAKEATIDTSAVISMLEHHAHVDVYEVDINNRKISFSLVPEGFMKTKSGKLTRSQEGSVSVEDIIDGIEFVVKISRKPTLRTIQTLPEKEDEFNKYFVNFESNTVHNKIMFMRRIIGTVSYYSTYSPELYPTVSKTDVALEMNDAQFNLYEKARGDERKKEKASKSKKKSPDSIFSSSGQVYRFYSRAICNFGFPEGIDRPFPSKLSQMSKEIDEEDADMLEKTVGKEVESKKDLIKMYVNALNSAVAKLVNGEYLATSEVEKYSPKFKHMFEKIDGLNGKALIYSQFRKVEGLGLFAEFLKKNGYAEFKIKRENNEWVLDIAEEDMKKPKFISFTGSNEETRVLLDIFNGIYVPPHIADVFKKGTQNLYGEIIKVIMITKSGSEGISLKNVRQVHIMEPYWNHIRVDQVIGRAVRTKSHIDLPKEDRTVDVFIYYMKASKKQIKNSFSVRTQDKSMTSDEYILDIAKRKAKIINEFLTCMQRASVDCALNAKKHGGIKCFMFPINIKKNAVVFKPNIAFDVQDAQYDAEVETHEWLGKVLKTKQGDFLVRPDTLEVYDYDLYVSSGRLVLLGTVSEDFKKITKQPL